MTHEPGRYVGRFAPSPTGPLHFGSLLAAAASYAQARSHHGRWLVRIEDIDPPREQPGADQWILQALEAYGFEWDGPVSYQSQSRSLHDQFVQALLTSGMAYPCTCSRKDLAELPRSPLGVIYPGTCRNGRASGDVAIRVRTRNEPVEFVDGLQGHQSRRLETESGDFVIRRRDGFIAYQMAVTADDFDQGITEVVRGIDLMESTPRQIWLQRLLELPTPRYLHIAVAVNDDGSKLSKSSNAAAIDVSRPGPTLVNALRALQQEPPDELAEESPAEIWRWAIRHWRTERLSGKTEIRARQFGYG